MNNNKSYKLKPCPFCGCDVELSHNITCEKDTIKYISIECNGDSCGVFFDFGLPKGRECVAEEMWNNRHRE